MKPQRLERVQHEVQRALAEILRGIGDPRMGFVTVTRVEVSSELDRCKVYVSIIGDRHVAKQSMDVLERSKGFIRGELGHAVELRHTPELVFEEDRTTERAIALHKQMERTAALGSQVVDE